ncbi:hypothetical protein RCO48_16015 [Peribacillus frigoritolerans]|nr:hypothetical protein [Peribacillus frigoritolerans]
MRLGRREQALSLRIENVKIRIVINDAHKSFSLHRVVGYGILIFEEGWAMDENDEWARCDE